MLKGSRSLQTLTCWWRAVGNLFTVFNCPGGTFQGAGVKNEVLFFGKGTKIRDAWHEQLDPSAAWARLIL
jgi:hypothetical protein